MKKAVLEDYLKQHEFLLVQKKKKHYLTYEGIKDRYVYILKEGIVKTSMISKEGREFNLKYINDMEIVSLFKDEYSPLVEAPFNIRVESAEATLYKIEREQFWRDVNQDLALQQYVKEYYRVYLMYTMKKMQQMLMNGKFGAICAELEELCEQFGVQTPEGTLIDFEVTNEEIARFCGITSASSVNRMMQKLRQEHIIKSVERKILILDRTLLQANIPY
ncbi:Crp/Fnr family transcriptional regulator [uncultured Enterococcus sp.]|uniref:Crp/Fnr family transcriptional regulator n=1 Tax=uncultured Enterococcus sp. TaxID=167972 RepID=UPI0025F503FC|nr:Crp/Fnr family transcriptional regulator [uncultured Enterococcus sp.]